MTRTPKQRSNHTTISVYQNTLTHSAKQITPCSSTNAPRKDNGASQISSCSSSNALTPVPPLTQTPTIAYHHQTALAPPPKQNKATNASAKRKRSRSMNNNNSLLPLTAAPHQPCSTKRF